MAIYESFSRVYDKYMSEVPYEEWCEYLEEIFQKHHKPTETGLICDLGCGTGNMTLPLAKKGYDMIGVDISADMLSVAGGKAKEEGLDILFINSDMTNFELYGTVDAAISMCDCVNYLLEEEELEEMFATVNNYLHPKGLFVFDINTEYKFKNILSDNTFCQTDEDSACTWENYYDEESRINEYYTNFFLRDEETGLYIRKEEIHTERAYTIEEIRQCAEKAGLEYIAAYDELTFSPPKEDSTRIFFVMREKGKSI